MIRRATQEDFPKCSKLIQLVVSEINSRDYSAAVINAWIEQAKDFSKYSEVVVCEENDIIGVGALKGNHIGRVYVHPEHHRKGIGKLLVETLEDIVRQKGYKTCTLNSTSYALDFYKALGYQIEGPHTIEEKGVSVTFTRMNKKLT